MTMTNTFRKHPQWGIFGDILRTPSDGNPREVLSLTNNSLLWIQSDLSRPNWWSSSSVSERKRRATGPRGDRWHVCCPLLNCVIVCRRVHRSFLGYTGFGRRSSFSLQCPWATSTFSGWESVLLFFPPKLTPEIGQGSLLSFGWSTLLIFQRKFKTLAQLKCIYILFLSMHCRMPCIPWISILCHYLVKYPFHSV